MKETYNSNSRAIYTKALEVAAEEVAFYQSKLETSKQLFSLCERLLGGLEKPVFYRKPFKNFDIKIQPYKAFEDEIVKLGGREKLKKELAKKSIKSPIKDALLPIMSTGMTFTSEQLAKKTGVSLKSIQNWLCANKNIVEADFIPGQLIRKGYKLINKIPNKAVKTTAFTKKNARLHGRPSVFKQIEKSIGEIKDNALSVDEIKNISGVSRASVFRWVKNNQNRLEFGNKPCAARKGWTTPTYKLK